MRFPVSFDMLDQLFVLFGGYDDDDGTFIKVSKL